MWLVITNYKISSVMHAFWLILTYDLLEDRRIDDIIIKTFFLYVLILYYIKQIDSKLPCICSVIDHRGRQNVVRTSVTWLCLVCHFFVLTTFWCHVIYYWTDAQQLGIYLLNRTVCIMLVIGQLRCHACVSGQNVSCVPCCLVFC